VPQPEDRRIFLQDILTSEDFAEYNGGAFSRQKPDLKNYYNGTWQIGATG